MTGISDRAIIDVQGGNLSSVETLDIDLSVARSNPTLFQVQPCWGIAVDPAAYATPATTTPSSTLFCGVASVQIGRPTMDPIRLEGGSLVKFPPGVTQLWITNAAQASHMMRLYICPPPWEVKFYLKADVPFVGPASAFAVAVTNAATLISAAQPDRASIMVANNDPALVLYVGFTSGVTTATGFPIAPGEAAWWAANTSAVYGISPGANIDARVTVEG